MARGSRRPPLTTTTCLLAFDGRSAPSQAFNRPLIPISAHMRGPICTKRHGSWRWLLRRWTGGEPNNSHRPNATREREGRGVDGGSQWATSDLDDLWGCRRTVQPVAATGLAASHIGQRRDLNRPCSVSRLA
uniref:Uncharacterized protein n=1 Tax=Plectus sambesii TaxID=2011161 RepID=A0A914WXD2_9BILA